MYVKSLLGALVAAVLVAVALAVSSREPPATVLGRADDQIALFIWGKLPGKVHATAKWDEEVAQGNPLRLHLIAFRLLHQHKRSGDPEALALAERVLQFLLTDYQPAERSGPGVVWHYSRDYDSVKAPWYSGMDQFFGPLTLLAAYEATGKQAYRAAALASIRMALRSPAEGGALWKDGGHCWISEYAWRGMETTDEFHVLNGHLFGLLALTIFNEVEPAEDLAQAYRCARDGTLASQRRFYRNDGEWTWYQLKPRVINPPHYSLIELSLFRSLRLVTGDPAYRQPEQQRVDHFRKLYPMERNAGRLLMAGHGAPHPYRWDVYDLLVTCESWRGTMTMTGSPPVLSAPADAGPLRCSVAVDTTGYTLPLYSASILGETSALPERLDGPLGAELDARVVNGSRVLVSPQHKAIPDQETYANDEGRIVLPVKRDIRPRDSIAVVVNAQRASDLSLLMTDASGKVAHRSYADLPAGRDFIVLVNPLGFEGAELGRTIDSLTLRVLTEPGEEDYTVEVKRAEVIRSGAQLEALLAAYPGEALPEN